MIKLTTAIFIFISTLTFAQTNFDKGFSDGYKKGYCQDQGNCIEPIPPIAPIPGVYENSSNYQDGYNRGFQQGLNAQKSNNSSSNRTRYQTSKPEFINFNESKNNLKIDYSLKQKMDQRYSDLKYVFETLLNRINDDSKITKNYNQYLEIREKYLNIINDAMKLFNRNKIEILKSEDLTGELWWELLTIGSDFNSEMENNGF